MWGPGWPPAGQGLWQTRWKSVNLAVAQLQSLLLKWDDPSPPKASLEDLPTIPCNQLTGKSQEPEARALSLQLCGLTQGPACLSVPAAQPSPLQPEADTGGWRGP